MSVLSDFNKDSMKLKHFFPSAKRKKLRGVAVNGVNKKKKIIYFIWEAVYTVLTL